ncbi:MAG: DegQ family serine endoprotease [Gallionella sp.]
MLKNITGIIVMVFGIIYGISVQAKELPDFADLVEKHAAAVVNISTTKSIRSKSGLSAIPEGDQFLEFFRRFSPKMPRDRETHSLGSGFIISSDGYIITNAHVVDRSEKITVRLNDKREFNAKIIGADKRTDVALLKIEGSEFPTLSMGDPEKLRVGEWVVAIGSPYGFDSSVTAGIVSAKGRSLPRENYVPFIQTDVAINPGNSGGPLFNLDGEVVGVNSQIYTRTGGSMGLSFAIPIDVATQVVDQLRSTGKVTRGRIGVTIQELTSDLAESFGLSSPNGALVSSVEKNGPADKSGIEASDVILKFDGKLVNNSSDLPRIVAATMPGSKVQIEVWRKGKSKIITLSVGEMPEEGKLFSSANKKQPDGGSETISRLGIVVSELSKEQADELDINGGLLVEKTQTSSIRSAGLNQGDILTKIGNSQIKSLKQFNKILGQVRKGKNVALLVKRGENALYVAIKLDEE